MRRDAIACQASRDPFVGPAAAGIAYHCVMRRLAFATALLLSACAAESANGPGARTPRTGDEIVCREEATTGSAISRRVCRGPEQRANEEAFKQSWMTGWDPHNPMRGDLTYPGMDLRHPAPPPSTETTYLPPQPKPAPSSD